MKMNNDYAIEEMELMLLKEEELDRLHDSEREAIRFGISALNKINQIDDIVEGTIDHLDRDDAIDLIQEIKDVLRNTEH